MRFLTYALIVLLSNYIFSYSRLQAAESYTGNKENLHVYLLIGQSNMAGRAPIPEGETGPLNHVHLLNGSDQWELATNPLNAYSTIRKDLDMQLLGPGWSFAKTMLANAGSGIEIGLVVNARGATSINKWKKGSSYYKEALNRIQIAQETGTLKGILWHQGESDENKSNYLSALKTLVEDLRNDLNAPNLPFIAGEIYDNSLINNQLAQLPDELSQTAVASAESLVVFDQWHFDSESIITLGERYAQAQLQLQGSEGNTAPLVNAGDDQSVGNEIELVSLDATVTDDGNPDGVLTYEWSQVSGPASGSIATADSEDTTVTLPQSGTYVFRLTASDGELSVSDDVTIVRESDLGDMVYAVNAGGPAYTTKDGIPYEADNYYTSGDGYTKSHNIAGTEDDTLFHSERYSEAPGTVDYAFPVSNGSYLVTLYWSENTASGGRLMDVSAEDAVSIMQLDVTEEAGGTKTAYETQITVIVVDGELNLSIAKNESATENYPNIMAIRIDENPAPPPAERQIIMTNIKGYVWDIDPAEGSEESSENQTEFNNLNSTDDYTLTPLPAVNN